MTERPVLVQKFGGTSVVTPENRELVVEHVRSARDAGAVEQRADGVETLYFAIFESGRPSRRRPTHIPPQPAVVSRRNDMRQDPFEMLSRSGR